uniref:Uncharacterized protein n=1 Tax=Strongyloides stercoralis TaxID=6248 RepID=A0A0K0ENS3_STRER
MNFLLLLLFVSFYIINGEIYFNENPQLSDLYNKIGRENMITSDNNMFLRMPTNVVPSSIPFSGFPNYYQNVREFKIEPYRSSIGIPGC